MSTMDHSMDVVNGDVDTDGISTFCNNFVAWKTTLWIFKEKIEKLKLHIFVKNEQYNIYSKLKEEMPENALLVHVDYSENYENEQQDECQSAYFGHSTFSIFTAVVSMRKNVELLHESITIVSQAKNHSRIAAFLRLLILQ